MENCGAGEECGATKGARRHSDLLVPCFVHHEVEVPKLVGARAPSMKAGRAISLVAFPRSLRTD